MNNQQLIQEASATFHQMAGLEAEAFESQWIDFSSSEWISNTQKNGHDYAMSSISCLRSSVLDFIIQKVNQSDYGASCNYELFEERRQDKLRELLSVLSLTEEESNYFKDKTDFIEEFCPYEMICEECGKEDSTFASAKSLQMEGLELCSNCLDKRYC